MREYAKLAPTFWTGTTGRALRRRGSEAVVVALYLVSSPHSNMLGLYYQPLMYMAHETGLGIEGASKGLRDCIECSFCSYDEASEMVFVHEMAAWQVAESLSSGDKRCKGIQKDYDALPDNPFLEAWFDRYAKAFHLDAKRSNPVEKPEVAQGASQAPSKPHRSQEQEQEQEQESPEAKASAADAAGPLTAKDRVWLLGPPLVGDKGRSALGKLAKTYGEEMLAEVLSQATLERPIEPLAWVTAALQQRAKARPPDRNGHQQEHLDLTANPKPEWAIKAGFPNRFEAENAGCKERTAHLFRNGQRIAA
jgi:hypothetical protein